MRKFTLLIAAIVSLSLSQLYAQNPDRCSTTEVMNRLKLEDPTYQERLDQIESYTQEWIKNNPGGTRTSITIPVVVHIVWNTTAENVTDAQVQTQIDVLNEDFRRLNPDVNETRASWLGVAADCEINFCLAQRDPSGNATTGIIHKNTSKTSFTTNDNVKKNTQGGDDAWDRNQYLNLWCCDLSGTTIGYAQFPGGPATTDGVVIDYFYFGRGGSAHAPYDLGRTATHEVGHWLNCFHIWGDDGTGCTGSDQCADTPNQADQTFGCPLPTIRISCTNGPNGDMYENYMDYTDDGCMNLFTLGQKSRMQALFGVGGSRASLATSQGCVPPGGSVCNIPSGLNATAITATSATLNWSAASGAISYNVQYSVVGSGIWTSTTSATTSKAISGLIASTEYEFQVESACSGGATSGFSTSTNFTTSAPACTDIYENNNTKANAKPISTGVTINALIKTATDKDFFSFTNTVSEPNLRITVSSMPTDYDLDLFNTSGTKIATSANAGIDDEVLVLNTSTVGTYKVRVFSGGGGFSASDCYDLLVEISASPFRTDATQSSLVSGLGNVETIYPNPSQGSFTVVYTSTVGASVQLFAYDMMGRVVYNANEVAVDGDNTFNISLNNLTTGVYVFAVNNGTEISRMKFSIEK